MNRRTAARVPVSLFHSGESFRELAPWRRLVTSPDRQRLHGPRTIDSLFNRATRAVKGAIVCTSGTLGGAPRIAGTRIPVYTVLGLVEEGYSVKRILRKYPYLTCDQIESTIRFARIVLET